MTFDDIKDNDNLISELEAVIHRDKVHHAYIVEGPLSAEKEELAKAFAMALLCREKPGVGCGRCDTCAKVGLDSHIDVTVIRAHESDRSSVKSIRTEDIEKMITRLMTKPYEGDRNIAIINDADAITSDSYNKLLKTLEEPSQGTVMILLSENCETLPQTIRSRAVILRMRSNDSSSKESYEAASALIDSARRADDYHEIKKCFEQVGNDRQKAMKFLDSMEDVYRSYLVSGTHDVTIKKDEIYSAVDEIEKARDRIKRKLNVQYALKRLALHIGGAH